MLCKISCNQNVRNRPVVAKADFQNLFVYKWKNFFGDAIHIDIEKVLCSYNIFTLILLLFTALAYLEGLSNVL